MEYFLLECILLKYCRQEGIDATSENVTIVYNATVEVSTAIKDDLPLATKDNEAIMTFLREHEHILQLYQTLCVAEIQGIRSVE